MVLTYFKVGKAQLALTTGCLFRAVLLLPALPKYLLYLLRRPTVPCRVKLSNHFFFEAKPTVIGSDPDAYAIPLLHVGR